MGAEGPFTGPEPFCGYGQSHFKMLFSQWERRKIDLYWERALVGSHSRDFVYFSKKRTEQALQLSRKDLRTLVGLFTGHCRLRSHMVTIGKGDDRTCRLCLEEDETARHILCECPAIARIRYQHFGDGFPEPSVIRAADPKEIIKFSRELEELLEE